MATAAESAVHAVIASLIADAVAPAHLILVVEEIQHLELPTKSLPALRLLLSDGQLCVQALIRTTLHGLVKTNQLVVGSIVDVSRYKVVIEEGEGEGRATVVLDVERLEVIGQWREKEREQREEERQQREKEAELDERDVSPPRQNLAPKHQPVAPTDKALLARIEEDAARFGYSFSDIDFTESFFQPDPSPPPPPPPPPPRQPVTPGAKPIVVDRPIPRIMPAYKPSTYTDPSIKPVALFRRWLDRSQPLKLTALGSLPFLPYKTNWTCNVLAIVSSLGPVETGILAPLQRLVHLVDPSSSRPVRLTVFLDPEEFTPPVGVPVLLVGVKNHTFDGGSLNKYLSDVPLEGQRWWYTDLRAFPWCNIEGLEEWWNSGVGGVQVLTKTEGTEDTEREQAEEKDDAEL